MPSKRVIALLISCVLIIVAIVITRWDRTPVDTTYENTDGPLMVVTGSLRNTSGTDTDNDGLRDWEEVLWKTDPNNPDSDGDGRNDGAEIDEKRDPLKKGPNDTISISNTAAVSTADSKPLSETEKLSRELFTGYIEARKSPDFSQKTGEMVSTLASEQIGQRNTFYSSRNTFSINDSSENTVRNYANEMGKVLATNQPKNVSNELEIMDIALKSNDPNELTKLEPIIKGYQSLITGFAKVPAPNDLKTLHIQFLNDLDTVLGDIKDFKKMFNDPIVGFSALARYYDNVQSMQTTIQDIQDYFSTKSISFEQSEYGSFFLHII